MPASSSSFVKDSLRISSKSNVLLPPHRQLHCALKGFVKQIFMQLRKRRKLKLPPRPPGNCNA
jgi:hypothetical protein